MVWGLKSREAALESQSLIGRLSPLAFPPGEVCTALHLCTTANKCGNTAGAKEATQQ